MKHFAVKQDIQMRKEEEMETEAWLYPSELAIIIVSANKCDFLMISVLKKYI